MAWEKNLYTLQHAAQFMKPDHPDATEDWFSNLEHKASNVHRKMLAAGTVAELTLEERTTLACFLRSFLVRLPGMLRAIDQHDSHVLAAQFTGELREHARRGGLATQVGKAVA